MGEYAIYGGESVKIGTCEDMYYLRADQVHRVRPEPGSVDPVEHVHDLRFRFPFPDEDGVAPGAFEDYDRGIFFNDVEDEHEHHEHRSVQFGAEPGWFVSLPCPSSPAGKRFAVENGLAFHKNGFSGEVKVVQQRVLKNGVRCIVVACTSCGSKWRHETLALARPYLDACEREAQRERGSPGREESVRYWEEIAARIRKGYDVAEKTKEVTRRKR